MHHRTILATVGVLLVARCATFAGNLEPPGSTTNANTAMYSLDDIRLHLGGWPLYALSPSTTNQPSKGPTDNMTKGSGPSLDDCMAKAPVADDVNGATTNDVRAGRTFWSLRTTGGEWGLQTGAVPTRVLSPATPQVTNGFYADTNLTMVDNDLLSTNIRANVKIFGVLGCIWNVDTSSGDASGTDIRSGKTAWVDGGEVTGTIPTRTLSDSTNAVSAGYYAATNLAVVDSDLAYSNIVGGVKLFGISGTSTVANTSSGTAEASDILTNKTAWVKGVPVSGAIVPLTLSPDTNVVSAGYYAGTSLNQVDPDLASGNIVTGVTIFGIQGKAGAEVPVVPLPRTGQTNSYYAADDGALQRGKKWPTARFVAGTGLMSTCIIDNLTGLMWAKDASLYGQMTWSNAVTNCHALTTLGGTNDWRLPNVRELRSLLDYGQYEPALPAGHPFTNVMWNAAPLDKFYWTSTTYVIPKSWPDPYDVSNALCVNMRNAASLKRKKSLPGYVWPVRTHVTSIQNRP